MMRNIMKKSALLVLCIALLCVLAVGCAQPQAGKDVQGQGAEVPVETQEAEEPGETASAGEPESMEEADGDTVSFTDMAGRMVEISTEVGKVYGTDPVASITVYTLAPDMLLGWNYEFSDLEKQYIPDEYASLPVYGMRDTFNPEAVIADAPGLILQMGAINDSAIETADEMQEQLNIPVIILSSQLEDMPAVYQELGSVLGREEDGNSRAATIQAIMDNAASMDIPDDERVTIYYGNGVDSLETAPRGTISAEVLEASGGINVADVEFEKPSDRVIVSKEQVIAWNPEYMFVNGEPKEDVTGIGAADEILADEDFATVAAVENGNVYGIPKTPFSWLDRPQAPNRIVGLVWAPSILYPDYYPLSGEEVTQAILAFYEEFYHVRITAEELDAIMNT
ncbi:ABC transporter substrate-binding protein [Christensenellaceae bacterium OttesenSCG-928-K19]|nr:ABC transporter substrate-binding protein [Christensenellaceae bacterium OttesenSCG-928-K19]